MIRGLLTGSALGAFVAGLVLSVMSLVSPQPAGNTPPAPPQTDVASAESVTPEPETSPILPEGEEPPQSLGSIDGPVMSEPPVLAESPSQVGPTEQAGVVPAADTDPAAQPQFQASEPTMPGDIVAPDPGSSPDVAVAAETAVLPNPQGLAPQVPTNEGDLRVATDPAVPPAAPTDAATEESFVVVDPVGTPVALGEPVDPVPGQAAPETAPMDVPAAEAPAADVVTQDTVTSIVPEVVQPDISKAPEASPVIDAPPVIPPVAEADQQPEVAQLPVAPLPKPRVGLSGDLATAMPSGDTSVRVIRPEGGLTLGDNAAPSPAAVQDAPGDVAPALTTYAADFENPDALTMMSIVLVDDGTMPGGPDALSAAPFPVSVAINPSQVGASELMAAYRARGIEVLAMLQLAEGAQPVDVEVALAAGFAALPEAIGVLDIRVDDATQDRAANTQLMSYLAADGRGYITVSRGLNPAMRAAETAQVPAIIVYRDLDDEGQDARVIRRFLDQAAFRARQESGVVLLGHVRPDTISALILWGDANRAGQVAQAPVSAVLMQR